MENRAVPDSRSETCYARSGLSVCLSLLFKGFSPPSLRVSLKRLHSPEVGGYIHILQSWQLLHPPLPSQVEWGRFVEPGSQMHPGLDLSGGSSSAGRRMREWRLQNHPSRSSWTDESRLINGVFCRTTWHVLPRGFDIGASGQETSLRCEYFSLLMMSRSGLEQSVVRTGLWPVSWAQVGQQTAKERKKASFSSFLLLLMAPGWGRTTTHETLDAKMDKTIAWSWRGTAWCPFRPTW